MATKNEKDLKYSLDMLVKAVDRWTNAKNVYPVSKKSFEELEKADYEIGRAITLAKIILKRGIE